jgi:hypothetical protein
VLVVTPLAVEMSPANPHFVFWAHVHGPIRDDLKRVLTSARQISSVKKNKNSALYSVIIHDIGGENSW